MKAIAQQNGTVTPAVHLEFIQNQAGLPEERGLAEIEAYHRALFLHHHAREMEMNTQQARIHQDRLDRLETQLKEVSARLAGQDKVVPVAADGQLDTKPTAPWNGWDVAMFVAAGLGISCLMVFGVLNISFNLLESGLVTFVQNPVRSYFWAALLPIGALGVKIGWDSVQSQKRRDFYLGICLTLGMLGVLVWLAAYSMVYPTLSKTTTEHLQSLSVFDQPGAPAGLLGGTTVGGVKIVDAIIVSAQAIAEIFLSAALGIYMTVVYARHRPVRLAANPLFTQMNEERQRLEQEIARERLEFGEAKGNQTRLENELSALVAFARSLFQKESALRRDQSQQQRILLDQISDQLRHQLNTLENGNGNGDRNGSYPLPPANRK
jgi:hypothetical protein